MHKEVEIAAVGMISGLANTAKANVAAMRCHSVNMPDASVDFYLKTI